MHYWYAGALSEWNGHHDGQGELSIREIRSLGQDLYSNRLLLLQSSRDEFC